VRVNQSQRQAKRGQSPLGNNLGQDSGGSGDLDALWAAGADAIAARPDVDYVVLDQHWSMREIVLKSGERISRPRAERPAA
jgi:hypothetical protein